VCAAHGVQVIAGDGQVLQHTHHLDQHNTVLLRERQPAQRLLQLRQDAAVDPLLLQLLPVAGQHHIKDHAHVSHARPLPRLEARLTLTLTRLELSALELLQRLQVGRQHRQPRLVHDSSTAHLLLNLPACCIVLLSLLLAAASGCALALRYLRPGLLLLLLLLWRLLLVVLLPRGDVTQVEHAQHLQASSTEYGNPAQLW
jgi:hypothetical protein